MRWQDGYTRKAFKEGYRARSVFKLDEINSKFSVIRKGMNVLDLGCHPGSWIKWCAERVGKTGKVFGIDIKSTADLKGDNIKIIKHDVFEITEEDILSELGNVDVVCSDMAPNTSGDKNVDVARSISLASQALKIAVSLEADAIIKYFQGRGSEDLIKLARSYYVTAKSFKPKSSRDKSVEMFLVCKGRNNHAFDDDEFVI